MNSELNIRSKRKDQHVKHALSQKIDRDSDFNHVYLIHQSLPAVNLDTVNLNACFGEFEFQSPIYINAMTGGSEWTKSINGKLAEAAAAVKIPMAVGSMHAAIKDDSVIDSFKIVREKNPDGIIFANVGADVSPADACYAVELLQADGLQIHINAPQELIMPEGDRDFKNWRENIIETKKAVKVPVIVKEVGFGMSKETIQTLVEAGIKYIDVSGKGGTNFAEIENRRRSGQDMNFLFNWGQSTVVSLIESKPFQNDSFILASGGVISPLDAVKSIALGANAVGISKAVLEKIQTDGVEGTVRYIEQFIVHMKKISVMVSAENIQQLQKTPVVLSPEIESWKRQRNL